MDTSFGTALVPVHCRTTEELERKMFVHTLMAMTDRRKRMILLTLLTFAVLC
jgi:hypothetical protein